MKENHYFPLTSHNTVEGTEIICQITALISPNIESNDPYFAVQSNIHAGFLINNNILQQTYINGSHER